MNNNNEYQPEVIADHEALSRYDDMLDDVFGDAHGAVSIAGLRYSVSAALEAVDPIAYRVGFSDYIDSMREEFTVEGFEE